MKRLMLITLMFLIGCGPSQKDGSGAYVIGHDMQNYAFSLIEATSDGKTHQYLVWWESRHRSGLTHYPECRYCKDKNTER